MQVPMFVGWLVVLWAHATASGDVEVVLVDDACADNEAECGVSLRQLRGELQIAEADADKDSSVQHEEGQVLAEIQEDGEEQAGSRDGDGEGGGGSDRLYPDFSTGFDEPGPYLEEPSDDEASAPQPAHEGWETPTSLRQTSNKSWGIAFCDAHGVGYYCSGSTRVRCCSNHDGFVKCGTTARSSACGYSGGVDAGEEVSSYATTENGWYWRRRRSWGSYSHHPRGYCSSHHTGNFCFSHHVVHCCFDHGYYVDCTTRSESSRYC